MNTVERIKSICKERKIAISQLEKDLGFGNAYIAGLKKGTVPDDRLGKIAEYLDVSITFLMTGTEPSFGTETDFIVEFMNNPTLKETLKKFNELKISDKAIIMSLIDSLYEKVEG